MIKTNKKDILEKYKELKKRNEELEEVLKMYENVAKVVLCSKCHLPLVSNMNRIRVLFNRRSPYNKTCDKQIEVYHINCWKKFKSERSQKTGEKE